MQTVRNFFFYFAPILGGVLGGVIGMGYHTWFWLLEVLIGFGAGCLVSGMMIAFSIRARFKSDVTLTRSGLPQVEQTDANPKSK